MQKVAQMALLVCMLVMTFHIHTATSAPVSWRPQGRFGKRGSTAADGAAFSGEIEVPVEAMTPGDRTAALQVLAKVCSLTGLKGFPSCRWSPDSSSETY